MRNFRAEALENRDSLPVSRQRQTDGLFAFGNSPFSVAGGEEREEGKWPFATTNASPPRNFLSFEKRKNFRLSDEVNRGGLLSVCRIIVGFLDEI